MKKVLLFVLFLVFTIFLFNKFYITGYSTLKIDESEEISGKTVIVKQISAGSIVVEVNGISDIISLGSYKDVNGIKVTVNEIFFVDEKEGRFVKLSLESLYNYVCGDGKCEGDETKKTCCEDCGCDSGYICEKNLCILKSKSSKYDECKGNEDCDDKNEITIDRCEGVPKKCVHKEYYQCNINKDCDDKNECTKDECMGYECFNTKISGCKSEIEEEKLIKQLTKESPTPITKEGQEEKGFLSKLFNILFGWLK